MARSGLKRYRKKYRRNPSESTSSSSRPMLEEIGAFVGPGFVGFAATRFLTRIASQTIAKKKPSLGKHAGALASVGSFLAAWLLAHKWRAISRYQMPLIVGSGLAAAQSLLQLYVPKLGWMVADCSPELAAAKQSSQLGPNAADLEPVDEDPSLYVYNDSFDAGRMSSTSSGGNAASSNEDSDLTDLDLGEEVGNTQNLGIFSAGAN